MQLVDTHDPYTPLEQFGRDIHPLAPEGYPYTAVLNYGSRLRKRFAENPDWTTWADETMPLAFQEHMSRLYDACVTSADHCVGLVLEELESLGLTGRTLVVFTSDHGDEFLDHGLLGHGQSLHGELTRVPLILAGPGAEPGRESRMISNRDLAFTLAQLGGGDLGFDGECQDLLRPDDLDDRAVFLSTHHGLRGGGQTPLFGVRKGDWLYTMAPNARKAHERERLYRVTEDPMELNNLATTDLETLRSMQLIVEARLERSKETGPKQGYEAGEAILRFFEKIGYAGD